MSELANCRFWVTLDAADAYLPAPQAALVPTMAEYCELYTVYEWHLVEGFDSRVVRLKGQRRGEVPPGNLVGAVADEIYDFEAAGAGQTTLVFAQYRDWEGPTRAVETLRYPVTVK